MKIGDKVIMNNKYVVTEINKNKVFTVKSQPYKVCGTDCVKGYRLCRIWELEWENY